MTTEAERPERGQERPTIYRCGWCGTPVESDGGPLAAEKRARWPHPDQYLAAHADARTERVSGFCCPNGDDR